MSPSRSPSRRRPPVAKSLTAGPWSRVRSTTDPYDDKPDWLADATNLFIADPEGKSGAYARPGMSLQNNGSAIVSAATAFRGQLAFSHTSLAGVTTNFLVFNGKLIRVDAQLITFTDVTPVGVTINNAVTTRVYATSFADQLIITDGVNRPWLATNLTSTPITGTYIDFDSVGGAWTAFGPFEVYGGSVFCILGSVGGVGAQTDIAWSLPADASQGYQQTNYDFRWTLMQTGSTPLYALAGTNTQLYYWRENSIGSISGVPGPNLSGQATHDAISRNVGTLAPQSVVQYGSMMFFTDSLGRPYRYVQGSTEPEPIWLDMRAVVDASTFGFPGVTKTVLTAVFEPTLNLYIVAPWSCIPSQTGPAVEGYWFDTKSGAYFGRFVVGDGVQIETMGVFKDANGRSVMVVLGSAVAPTTSALATSGFMWTLNALAGIGDLLTTENGVFLTLEDGTTFLTTEGTVVNWTDNGVAPTIIAKTTRMGYNAETVLTVDRASVLVGSQATCTISAQTAAVAETVEGTPTPSTTQDGVARLTAGFAGIQGRGVEVTIQPTTATDQWSLQSVNVRAVVSLSAPDEV